MTEKVNLTRAEQDNWGKIMNDYWKPSVTCDKQSIADVYSLYMIWSAFWQFIWDKTQARDSCFGSDTDHALRPPL